MLGKVDGVMDADGRLIPRIGRENLDTVRSALRPPTEKPT